MKDKIPKALREQVWLTHIGKRYEAKCYISWCSNTITVFDFQSGHNIPESKGGPTKPENLIPICSRCNQSMGDRYTFDEWAAVAPAATTPEKQPQQVPEVPPPKGFFCCS